MPQETRPPLPNTDRSVTFRVRRCVYCPYSDGMVDVNPDGSINEFRLMCYHVIPAQQIATYRAAPPPDWCPFPKADPDVPTKPPLPPDEDEAWRLHLCLKEGQQPLKP